MLSWRCLIFSLTTFFLLLKVAALLLVRVVVVVAMAGERALFLGSYARPEVPAFGLQAEARATTERVGRGGGLAVQWWWVDVEVVAPELEAVEEGVQV